MQPIYNGCHGKKDAIQLFTQRVLYKGGINHDKTYEYQKASACTKENGTKKIMYKNSTYRNGDQLQKLKPQGLATDHMNWILDKIKYSINILMILQSNVKKYIEKHNNIPAKVNNSHSNVSTPLITVCVCVCVFACVDTTQCISEVETLMITQ